MSALSLVIVVVATCWVLSWSQTTEAPKGDEIAQKCLKQENVTFQYLSDFINGKIPDAAVSQNFKCFVRCHMDARGYMKNGQIMEANVVKAAENITSIQMMRKIIADCKIVKAKDACQTSYDVFMCISNELP